MKMDDKTVLSKEDHEMLIEICKRFGTAEEARKDPGFILRLLLQEIRDEKNKTTTILSITLEDAIGKARVQSIVRRVAEEVKAEQRRKRRKATQHATV